MSIHQRFKEVRKKLNFTQSEFGEQLGKKLRVIQYYEASDSSITLDIILLLKEKFNVNTDWLINGNGSMFIDNNIDEFSKIYNSLSDENKLKALEYIKTLLPLNTAKNADGGVWRYRKIKKYIHALQILYIGGG